MRDDGSVEGGGTGGSDGDAIADASIQIYTVVKCVGRCGRSAYRKSKTDLSKGQKRFH